MQKEIEMKCHITEGNKSRIENFLQDKTTLLGSVEKYDYYFEDPKNTGKIFFRIREEKKTGDEGESSTYIVTKKKQNISSQGLEINDELEFEVSSFDAFIEFCAAQGIQKLFTKTKKITKYSYNDILIEWVSIDPIGEFLEVEIVTEEENINTASEKILAFFKELELENDIEKKRYFLLLKEKNSLAV